jgi:hypothetical protein
MFVFAVAVCLLMMLTRRMVIRRDAARERIGARRANKGAINRERAVRCL